MRKYLLLISIFLLIGLYNCSEKQKLDVNNKSNLLEIFSAYNLQQGNEDYNQYLTYIKRKYELFNENIYNLYNDAINEIKNDEGKWKDFLLSAKNYSIPKDWLERYEEMTQKERSNKQKNENSDLTSTINSLSDGTISIKVTEQ